MSLYRRTTAASMSYRVGYLQSAAWWARRALFFATKMKRGPLTCVSCGITLNPRSAHVHHLSYAGVVRGVDGTWQAAELDEDLIEMCPDCHRAIHDLFDHHKHWRTMGRRGATIHAIAHLRRYRHTTTPRTQP